MALLYHPAANTTRLYFGTDTHAQSILIGSVLACVHDPGPDAAGEEGMAPTAARARGPWRSWSPRPGRIRRAPCALTYTLVGTSSIDYRGGFMLSALSAAAIIVGAVCVPRGPIARVLSVRPLVWIGHHFLWRLPLALPGLRVRRLGADRPVRSGSVGDPLRPDVRTGRASYYLVERPVMYGTFWRSVRAIGPASRRRWRPWP